MYIHFNPPLFVLPFQLIDNTKLALHREAYFQSLEVVQFVQYSAWRKE